MNILAHIHTEPDDDGFSATFPTLPGCFTQGDTWEELMHNIPEAIDCHLGPCNVGTPEPLGDEVEEIEIPYKLGVIPPQKPK